jgi:hypothetical protein
MLLISLLLAFVSCLNACSRSSPSQLVSVFCSSHDFVRVRVLSAEYPTHPDSVYHEVRVVSVYKGSDLSAVSRLIRRAPSSEQCDTQLTPINDYITNSSAVENDALKVDVDAFLLPIAQLTQSQLSDLERNRIVCSEALPSTEPTISLNDLVNNNRPAIQGKQSISPLLLAVRAEAISSQKSKSETPLPTIPTIPTKVVNELPTIPTIVSTAV